jgi:hypothetical protein
MRSFRRTAIGLALVAVAATALVVVPAAIESPTANGLYAYVVAGSRGPIPACSGDGSNCGPANQIWHYVYVVNTNRLPSSAGGTTRETLPNAFSVSNIGEEIFIDGIHHPEFDFTFTPAPSPSIRSWTGRWPMTVTCQAGAPPDPCNEVDNPAVLPGEDAIILYPGWSHGDTEPNGTYVFRYTIHGTLNGAPVDLTATSPPIVMTSATTALGGRQDRLAANKGRSVAAGVRLAKLVAFQRAEANK